MSSKNSKPGLRVYLLFGGISLSIALLLFEISIRIFYPSFLNSLLRYKYLWPSNYQVTFYPDSLIFPGISGASVFQTNEFGFRGDALYKDGTSIILTLGGSTTECLYLDQNEAWPSLLETHCKSDSMPYVVFNGGKSALNSAHHKVQLEKLFPKELPVRILILKTGLNDILFYLKNGSNPDFDFYSTGGALENESATVVLAGLGYFRVKSLLGRFNRSEVQDSTGKIYNTWRSYYQNNKVFHDTLPDISILETRFKQNLGEIKRLCAQRGIQLVLLSTPVMWRSDNAEHEKNLFWMGGVGDYQQGKGIAYFTPGALRNAVEKMNSVINTFAVENNITFIDLAQKIEPDTTSFYDDCHFNEAGSEKAAWYIYEILKSSLVKNAREPG